MSEAMNKALEALKEKVGEGGVDASIKLDFEGEGAIVLDGEGARLDDGAETDCTVRADLDTFRAMFEGDLSPTSAFMTGKIKIEGDMGAAMKIAGLLG